MKIITHGKSSYVLGNIKHFKEFEEGVIYIPNPNSDEFEFVCTPLKIENISFDEGPYESDMARVRIKVKKGKRDYVPLHWIMNQDHKDLVYSKLLKMGLIIESSPDVFAFYLRKKVAEFYFNLEDED